VAAKVNSDYLVPLFVGHVEDHPIAKDARGVHYDVEPTERLNRLFDEPLAHFGVTDVVVIGDGSPTNIGNGADQMSDQVRIGILTVGVHARIVDHEAGT
jgi:hypothetical protein